VRIFATGGTQHGSYTWRGFMRQDLEATM